MLHELESDTRDYLSQPRLRDVAIAWTSFSNLLFAVGAGADFTFKVDALLANLQ